MSFQAYLDAIEARTGLTARQLMQAARERGFHHPHVDVDTIAAWLKDDYDLGRRYATALAQALRAEDVDRAS